MDPAAWDFPDRRGGSGPVVAMMVMMGGGVVELQRAVAGQWPRVVAHTWGFETEPVPCQHGGTVLGIHGGRATVEVGAVGAGREEDRHTGR